MVKKNSVAILRKGGGGGDSLSKDIKRMLFCLCIIGIRLRA
jgi:hypothetical protein